MAMSDDAFWQKLIVPCHDAIPEDPVDASGLDLFEADEKPEEKTRSEIVNGSIENSNILSVSEIREKFNHGTAVFPKSRNVVSTRKKIASSADSKVEAEGETEEVVSPSSPGTPQPTSPSDSAGRITEEEYAKLTNQSECDDSIAYFRDAKHIEVLIKNEKDGALTHVKDIKLHYLVEQRLLVMVRKGSNRFIRLNEVTRVDGTADNLSTLGQLPATLPETAKHGVFIYFNSTKNPLVLVSSTDHERLLLVKLLVFVRQMLKTDLDFTFNY